MRNSLIQFFSGYSANLSKVSTLTGVALFCALYITLSLFTFHLTPTLYVGFNFLALALSCRTYGLIPNLIGAFACDFLSFSLNPQGPYMPLFSLTLMLNAIIFSFFFYKKEKISFLNIVLAKSLCTLFSNILLNSLILTMMYQTPFFTLMATRIPKNLIMLPIECILLFFTFRAYDKVRSR